MAEIHPELLTFLFNINYEVIKQQTDSLSHEDSLLQPPFRGNCLNWVLGHILISRDRVLEGLGEKRVWDDETSAPYLREADPITPENSSVAQSLEKLLADFYVVRDKNSGISRRIAQP